jgi:hypothetical protein
VGKEKIDIIHAEGVRFAVPSSAHKGRHKAVSRREFVRRASGPKRSAHQEIAAPQTATTDQ